MLDCPLCGTSGGLGANGRWRSHQCEQVEFNPDHFAHEPQPTQIFGGVPHRPDVTDRVPWVAITGQTDCCSGVPIDCYVTKFRGSAIWIREIRRDGRAYWEWKAGHTGWKDAGSSHSAKLSALEYLEPRNKKAD